MGSERIRRLFRMGSRLAIPDWELPFNPQAHCDIRHRDHSGR